MANSKPPSKPQARSEAKPEAKPEEEVQSRRVPIYSTPREPGELQELPPDNLDTDDPGTIEVHELDPSLSTVMALAYGLEESRRERFERLPDCDPTVEQPRPSFEQEPREAKKAVLVLLRAVAKRIRG